MKIELGPKRRGDHINGPLYRLTLGDQYVELTPDELSKLTYLIDFVYNADITVEMEVIRTLEKVGAE
jgi:hypothetical protein